MLYSFFSQQVRGISILQLIWTVANVTLEHVPGTGMKFSLFFFLSCVCSAELLILDALHCFCGSFLFTTASFSYIYSGKNCFHLLQCLSFTLKEVLYLHTMVTVWVISPFGYILFFNVLFFFKWSWACPFLSEEGRFKSASGHRETECGDLNWDWNGSFTTVSTQRLLWLGSFT